MKNIFKIENVTTLNDSLELSGKTTIIKLFNKVVFEFSRTKNENNKPFKPTLNHI